MKANKKRSQEMLKPWSPDRSSTPLEELAVLAKIAKLRGRDRMQNWWTKEKMMV
jgi:hypothetical protein